MANGDKIIVHGFHIEPWRSLTDIPKQTVHTPEEPVAAPSENIMPNMRSSDVMKLLLDCIIYLFDKVRDRVKRLGFSIRIYESAKREAMDDGYLIASSWGKTVYLIPTRKAYERFIMPWPYERSVSVEHSFGVRHAAHTLKQDTTLSKVQIETPIGRKGSTIDVTTTAKNGAMTA